MMQLFNIDPSVPLESRMLGRLVEQSQERVEGHNFDIRKHLLEYDYVLNDQRERIYKERDRVLVKEDLEEDVLEMLRSEITRRVPEALADPEGPWKLLAFLEEMQPTFFYTQLNERILSFTLAIITNLLKNEAKNSEDKDQLKTAALNLAKKALEAEKIHLIGQTESFIERTAESFNTQLAERMELLDIFLDNIEDYAEMSTRELSDLLQNQVRLKISLTGESARELTANDRSTIQSIRDEVESQLMSTFLSRMAMTVERRLGGRLGVDLASLADKDWLTVGQSFTEAIEKVYSERLENLGSPASQIAQNIEAILKRQSDAGVVDHAELAAGMPQGIQAVIDTRSRQRVNRHVNLFNYIFWLPARWITNLTDITAEVLNHLRKANASFNLFGGGWKFSAYHNPQAKKIYWIGLTSKNSAPIWIKSSLPFEPNEFVRSLRRTMKELFTLSDTKCRM